MRPGMAFATAITAAQQPPTLQRAKGRGAMSGKGDKYLDYEVHGEGIDSIRSGFDELGMPPERRDEAFQIVREVLSANQVQTFRWYKTPGTNELACYWDDAPVNMLWVTVGEVHIDVSTPRPARSITWQKQGGQYVGWLLPGADAGTGGGTKKTEVATVLCPETFIRNPVGTVCPTCEVVHG